jgi:hypothetical protein
MTSFEVEGTDVDKRRDACCCRVTRVQGETDPLKRGTVQTFRNDSDKSEFDSGRN